MSSPLKLDIAVATYQHTTAVKDGSIPIKGVQANMITVDPQIAAFRRMVRDLEFDVCELAPMTYLIARAYGSPFTALPIFVMRRFHHGGLVCRDDAGIKGPKDLEGKKVGVRAYTVTTGAWTRGILANEFGVDNSKITWVVDDEEHVTQMPLPKNVVHAPEGKSLVKMMESGEIQAGFNARAGIGREGAPKAGWEDKQQAAAPVYNELFANAADIETEWFKRTGIYPMHGLIVVKDKVLAENPWVGQAIYDAFLEAKNRYVAGLRAGNVKTADDKKYAGFMNLMGDPLPYGFKANLATINAAIEYTWQQGMIPEKVAAEKVFVNLNG
jgi:4,5-dihydroxyphthalate decarboxylase